MTAYEVSVSKLAAYDNVEDFDLLEQFPLIQEYARETV